MLRRFTSTALILALLSFPTAYAQQESNPHGARVTSALSEFSDPPVGEAGTLRAETRLQRRIRLLRAVAQQPESYRHLGFSLELKPVASSAQTGNTALEDSQNGGLPWWAWAPHRRRCHDCCDADRVRRRGRG